MSVSEDTRRLGAERQRLEAALDELRPKLIEAIRRDIRTGARQIDVVKATGYNREMIRRIAGGTP